MLLHLHDKMHTLAKNSTNKVCKETMRHITKFSSHELYEILNKVSVNDSIRKD